VRKEEVVSKKDMMKEGSAESETTQTCAISADLNVVIWGKVK